MLGAVLGLYLGCGGGGDEDELGPEDSCSLIVGACHTKDDGSDPAINGCHTVGHDNVMSACQEQYSMCVELCDAAPNLYDTDGMEESSGGDDDDDDDDANDDGQTTGGDTMGTEDTDGGSTDGGSTGEPGTTSGSSSGGDDSSEASCAELGAGCHDTPTPLGMMCHDVGHGTDEVACAEIWLECKEECGF